MSDVAQKVVQIQNVESLNRELIKQSLGGDTRAFQELVEIHQDVIFRLIWKFVNDRGIAEDLSQEVFIRAFRSLGSFRGDSSFKTWLCRIAVNRCRSYLKYKSHWHSWLPIDDFRGSTSIESTLEARDEVRLLHAKINKLRPKIREVAVLVILEDCAYEEVAELLCIPIGTVSSRMNKALKVLRSQMAKIRVAGGDSNE